jgi:Na+/proline symporter
MMCIFNLILILIVAPIIIGGAILAAVPSLPSLLPSLTKPDEIPPELILPLMPQLIQNIGMIIAAVIIAVNRYMVEQIVSEHGEASGRFIIHSPEVAYIS